MGRETVWSWAEYFTNNCRIMILFVCVRDFYDDNVLTEMKLEVLIRYHNFKNNNSPCQCRARSSAGASCYRWYRKNIWLARRFRHANSFV